MGQRADSDAAVSTLEQRFSHIFGYLIAAAHAWRGEANAAFTWLDRAYRQRDGQMIFIKIDPLLRNVHGDPRYQAILAKMKLTEA